MGLVPTKSSYVLGIDLGTSTSIVSVYTKGKGKVLTIDGKDYMPSAVSFVDKDTKLVGEQAKSRAIIAPENTVTSIKRHMGDSEYKVKIFDEEYTPEQISGDILSKLIEAAMNQQDFDPNGDLKYAVICVPANFTDNAKQATKKAAEIAGLEVLYLLEEPVAASIMYGFNSNKDQNILVYDLGGGTFDVCILNAKTTAGGEYKYEILAKEGIPTLGGDDFDQRLMEHINKKFLEENGIDLLDLQKDQGINRKKLKQAQQKLKEVAEKAKMELSEMDSTSVVVPNIVQNEEGELLHLDTEVTREEFEGLIEDLVNKTEETVKLAIENGKLTIDDIDRIILVGGSTLVPIVKRKIKELFGKEPYSNFNPRTIVSEGAAIFGATLAVPDDAKDNGEAKPEGEIELTQQVTHNLGIMIAGMKFSKIIGKGTEIPPEASVIEEKEYTTQKDNQTEMSIYVYQCSEDIEFINQVDDEGKAKAVFIGEFKLKDIPAALKGVELINVRFEVNAENVIKVSATSKSTGRSEEITLNIERE
ncbi:Hsp70 family protein [Clostridium bovifaecis]|uniref:Chaperone protein DnaK n=1 Tax=Clostridium bovifaecis TaxID=2184719 RepID=A0A6I6F460_9CLOT|nr:Hsp70 family protein [Clostridium bovifaecis]